MINRYFFIMMLLAAYSLNAMPLQTRVTRNADSEDSTFVATARDPFYIRITFNADDHSGPAIAENLLSTTLAAGYPNANITNLRYTCIKESAPSPRISPTLNNMQTLIQPRFLIRMLKPFPLSIEFATPNRNEAQIIGLAMIAEAYMKLKIVDDPLPENVTFFSLPTTPLGTPIPSPINETPEDQLS